MIKRQTDEEILAELRTAQKWQNINLKEEIKNILTKISDIERI